MPIRRLFDGAQQQLGLLPFVYVVSGGTNGNASGDLTTSTLYALAGSATTTASVSALFATVSVSSSIGYALAPGAFTPIQVSALAATASGQSNAFGSTFGQISLLSQDGLAIGDAGAIGLLQNVLLNSQLGSSSGSALANQFVSQGGELLSIGVGSIGEYPISGGGGEQGFYVSTSPVQVISTGSSNSFGTFPEIEIESNDGSAFGSANIDGYFATVLIASQSGSAEVLYPPSWARSRIYSIVTATTISKLSNANNAGKQVLPIN